MPSIKPMTVAIWCGKGKPVLNDFLPPFVTELNNILLNGIQINGHELKVVIRCILGDTPARALLKGSQKFFEFLKRKN